MWAYRILCLMPIALSILGVDAIAQTRSAGSRDVEFGIREDIPKAASLAKIRLNDQWTAAFWDAAQRQPRAAGEVYSEMSSSARAEGIAQYLAAKRGVEPNVQHLGVADFGDFHWGYVGKKFRFYPARLEGAMYQMAHLRSVEVGGTKYDFGRTVQFSGNTVLLPAAPTEPVGVVTAEFQVEKVKVVWTGRADAGRVQLLRASTSAGCEIHVRSQPAGATVYFNGSPWHRRTETRSVRDPKEWEVIVRLTGYNEWRGKQTLGPGDSWNIDVVLTK